MINRIIQNNWIIALLLVLTFQKGYSQKELVSSGEYSFKIEKDQTYNQAKEIVIEQAKINAIEKAFGRIIMNGNTSYIQNEQANNKTDSKSKFNFYSDSFVKGEWLRDLIKPEISVQTIDDEQWIKAKVKGIIREINSQIVTFKLITAACTSAECETNNFKNNQDFFVGFQSPVSGYLGLFLEDINTSETSRILPYENSEKNSSSVKIEKNNFYWFFSKKMDGLDERNVVDELKFRISDKNQVEFYKLYILFSETPFIPPIFTKENSNQLNNNDIKLGVSLPKSLDSQMFQNWLQKFRGTNKKVQFDLRYLTLRKN